MTNKSKRLLAEWIEKCIESGNKTPWIIPSKIIGEKQAEGQLFLISTPD